MLKNLVLQRPLAVFDLETTGTDPQVDRIVEISVLKILPGGQSEHRTRRVNPGIPIPPEATAIHGITNADVAGAPRFDQVARDLLAFLDGCDLCGFNIKKFDLRMLYVEFTRAGLSMPLDGRAIVDPLEIFHSFERRDLSAAVRFYCGREHEGAHEAAADVLATLEVLDAMVSRYTQLPPTVAGIHQHFKDPNAIDTNGNFTRVGGIIQFTFGKYRGQPLHAIAQKKPDYLEWMLTQDFYDDVKDLIRKALKEVREQKPAPVIPPQVFRVTTP